MDFSGNFGSGAMEGPRHPDVSGSSTKGWPNSWPLPHWFPREKKTTGEVKPPVPWWFPVNLTNKKSGWIMNLLYIYIYIYTDRCLVIMARTGNKQILAYIAAPSLSVFLDKIQKSILSKLLWDRVPSIHDRYLPLTKIDTINDRYLH